MVKLAYEEGRQRLKALAKSESFITLQERFGQRPAGQPRIQILNHLLQHRSEYGRQIREKGFDWSKRNPYILGFAFREDQGGEEATEVIRGLFLYKVTCLCLGPVWVTGAETLFQALEAEAPDPLWNLLIQEKARQFGLPVPRPRLSKRNSDRYWRRDRRFTAAIRNRLLKEGIQAVHFGDEIQIMHESAIAIIKEGE
jgi:hypothetical protein